MPFAKLGEDFVSGKDSTCSDVVQASPQTFLRKALGNQVLEGAFDREALRKGLGCKLGFDFGLQFTMNHSEPRVAEQDQRLVPLRREKTVF